MLSKRYLVSNIIFKYMYSAYIFIFTIFLKNNGVVYNISTEIGGNVPLLVKHPDLTKASQSETDSS